MFNLATIIHDRGNITTGDFDILRGAQENDFDEVRGALRQDSRCITNVDHKGRTAAHIAAMLGFVEMVDFLSDQNGCDLRIKDDLGRDVYAVAFEAANPKLDHLIMNKLSPTALDEWTRDI